MFHAYATDFTDSHVSHFVMFGIITFAPTGCLGRDGDAYGERAGTRCEENKSTVIVTAGNVPVPSEFLVHLLPVMLI